MSNFNYYWYHHMSMSPEEIDEINDCIMRHNYDKFIEIYTKWNAFGLLNGYWDEKTETYYPLVYFPDKVSIYDDDTNTVETFNVLNVKDFNKIVYAECECG